MMKKIFLTLILCFLIFSCGKKGDPEYREPKNNAKIQNFLIIKI